MRKCLERMASSGDSCRQQVTTSRSQPAETAATEGTAGSAEAAAASIGKLPNLASDCDTLPKSTSESTDKENTYEIMSRRRKFLLHGTRDKSLQSIVKCYEDVHKNLHDGFMSPNDADALPGIGERMMKDRNAV